MRKGGMETARVHPPSYTARHGRRRKEKIYSYNGKFMSYIFLLMLLNCISKTAKMRGLQRWLSD